MLVFECYWQFERQIFDPTPIKQDQMVGVATKKGQMECGEMKNQLKAWLKKN
jgi:hypothetical protein